MPDSESIDPYLLDRVLSGEATPDEVAHVTRALGSSAAFRSAADVVDAATVENDWQQLKEQCVAEPPVTSAARGDASKRFVSQRVDGGTISPTWLGVRVTRWIGLGAVASLVVVLVMTHGRSDAPSRNSTTRTYTTAVAQRAIVALPNGGQAILAPATTLEVTSPDTRHTQVTIVGQAQFTIVHGAQSVFAVRAGNTLTRVLGTTFLVRRYDTDHATRIAVRDGKVSVHALNRPGRETVLAAGTFAFVQDSGDVITTPQLGVDDYTALANGRFAFRDTPARDVVTELNRAYGVDIRVPDSALAAHPLTWTVMSKEQSLPDVLDGLATLLDAHVVRTGHAFTLVRGRPAPRKSIAPRHPSSMESQYGQ